VLFVLGGIRGRSVVKHIKAVTSERPMVMPCPANAWTVFLNAVYQDTVDFVFAKLKLGS
jgi:hypothetical protein